LALAFMGEARMLYMVIERFRHGDPLPVYRRLRTKADSCLTTFATWRVG